VIAALTPELASLVSARPASRLIDGPNLSVVEVPEILLPAGWSATVTTVWFAVPNGYPAAQPDCFWAEPTLRLATGALPQNSGLQGLPVIGAPGLWFSWHLSAWRPGRDGLVSYVRFITRRFADVR
jgi:hypothetical protein